MLAIPASLWPSLLADQIRPVEVYEIEPIDTLAAIERVANGDFETWAGGPLVPAGWSVYPGSGTINRDATSPLSGTYSLRFDNPGAATLLVERYDLNFPVGQWVRVDVWIKYASAAVSTVKTQGYKLRIVNLTTVRELQIGGAWTAGNTGASSQLVDVGRDWQRCRLWFRTEDTSGAADNYAISIQQYNGGGAAWAAGEQMFVDAVSIMGGFERGGLYFANRTVSWGGNSYEGLAVARTPIKESIEVIVPDCEITFSNVTNVLRPYLYPVDQLTGSRVTVRLLTCDASFVAAPSSVILFTGTAEPIRRVTETTFPISVVGLIDGGGLQVPRRRHAIACQWQYANAGVFDGSGECAYVATTTATNTAASPSTALTIAGASWLDNNGISRTFVNGDLIQIGGGAEVAILSGAGTTSLTLAEARTWTSGNGVRFSRCNRSRSNCSARQQLYRYGGFPAGGGVARAAGRTATPIAGQEWRAARQAGSEFSDPTLPVPVLYGRRRVAPKLIELYQGPGHVRGSLFRSLMYAWTEGQVDANALGLRYYLDGDLGQEVVVSGEKDAGLYFRRGGLGVNDTETAGEYTASPSAQLRTQNIDYISIAGISYSHLATVILKTIVGGIVDAQPSAPQFEVDGKGLELVAYSAAGVAGSPAYSVSPIWETVDLLLSSRYGVDLLPADIDFAVAKESADYAAIVLNGTEANTTVKTTSASSTTCTVQSTEGFIAGRACTVNGVGNTIDRVAGDQTLILGTAVATTAGQAVIQQAQRFESHLYLNRVDAAANWIKKLMLACRGFITYDAGKIQLRIERDTVTDRIVNGNVEAWSNPTAAPDGWTFNNGSGDETIARDATSSHSGLYSIKLTRTGASNYAGPQVVVGPFEPGKWYRVEYWHRRQSPGAGNTNRCFLNNETRGLGCDADGVTWGASLSLITGAATVSFVKYEATFKIREDFSISDSYTLRFPPYFAAGFSCWYDDVVLRGPYAGDFRESTDVTPAGLGVVQLMGWAEGSFEWSLSRKDREVNRVALQFINESANFGLDEIASDDFAHQTSHAIKTLTLDCDAIADRDQGKRITGFHLAKRRELGPGCEFIGSPAALAVQPGDVILVSHTVPGWSCKEQRVIGKEILGKGDELELFVRIKTEDYSEAIYSDVGHDQSTTPTRPVVTLTVTINRHTGSILDLSWTSDVSMPFVKLFRIHSSSSPGFVPNMTNLIGQTMLDRFVYSCPLAQIEQLRYYRVVGVTDFGIVQSAEFSTRIYAVDYDATDGTHGEGNADGNMIYDSDYQGTEFQNDGSPAVKAGDGWAVTPTAAPTIRQPNPTSPVWAGAPAYGSSNVAFTSQGNAADGVAGTYALGQAQWTGVGASNMATALYTFPAGTRTGRAKVRLKMGGTYTGSKSCLLYVSSNGGSSWDYFSVFTATADTDVFTGRYTSQIMANFQIAVVVIPGSGGAIGPTVIASVDSVTFEEEPVNAVVAHCGKYVNNRAELRGDGTLYAETRRRFPGQTPPDTGTYLTTGTPNRWEIKAQRLTPGAAGTNPLEIRIEDAITGRVWTIASIAASDIVDAWTAFTGWFDPGVNPVSGTLDVIVRTKEINGYRCDQVSIKREQTMSSYQVSVEDQQKGRYPDLSIGEAVNWPKGKLVVGGYRKVTVS